MSEQETPNVIADEFLRDDKPPSYKANALTLLRVVGGVESVERIVREALHNLEPAVRSRAVFELRALTPADQATAAKLLREGVGARPSGMRGLRAYAALGTMGERAATATNWFQRVRFELLLHRERFPYKGFTFYTRTLKMATAGAVSAAILALLYLFALGILPAFSSTVPQSVVAYSLLAALIAAPVLTIRSLPFEMHVDRLTGVVAECLWPMPFHLALFALIYLLVSLFRGEPPMGFGSGAQYSPQFVALPAEVPAPIALSFPGTGIAWLVSAATVTVVRLASIVLSFRNKAGNRNLILTALVAGSLGSSFLTGFLLLRPNSLLTAFWAAEVPLIFSLSAAFAAVDAAGPAPQWGYRLPRTVAAGAAVLSLTVLLAAPFRARSGNYQVKTPGKQRTIEIRRLPEAAHFTLSSQTRVFVTVGVGGAKRAALADSVGWLLKDGEGNQVFPTAEMFGRPGIGLARTAFTVIRESPPDDYAIVVRSRKQRTGQDGLFDAVFASAFRPMKGVHLELFVSDQVKPGDPQPMAGISETPVVSLPFFAVVRVTSKTPFLYLRLDTGGVDYFPPLCCEVLRETGRVRIAPDERMPLAEGDYIIAVNDRPSPIGAPEKLDSSPRSLSSIPPGMTLQAGSAPLDSLPKNGPVILDKVLQVFNMLQSPAILKLEVPKGGKKALSASVVLGGSRVGYKLQLFDGDNNPLEPEVGPDFNWVLDPGPYSLVMTRQDESPLNPGDGYEWSRVGDVYIALRSAPAQGGLPQ